MLIPANLERALRYAAESHHGQTRKGSQTPYVQHVMAVALILDRLAFDEEVVTAGLLHDVVEDTEVTLDEVRSRFGENVASIVGHCFEVKTDSQGRKRPWEDRKRDHLEALAQAPESARAVVLADKLHNLVSIATDLRDGRAVWPLFNAGRDRVLWYHRAVIDVLTADLEDPRIARLARECREALREVESFEVMDIGR